MIGDNGAPLKIHKADAPGGGPGWDGSLNDPMNGEKGMLTEGGIRVPYVVHWKGRIPGGQVYSHPVITLDVAKTATALAGLPDDPALDGVNLLPYLAGEKTGAPHDALYWRWLGQSAIRKGQWKYLRSDDREYLFDMEADFEEKHNVLAAHPEIAATLRADLEKWAATLSPPGIWAQKSDGMSKAATEYYDWYLDGKRGGPTPTADAKGDRSGGKRQAKKDASAKTGPSDEQLFKQRDKNQDGNVTWEEYLAGRTEKVSALEQLFKRRDADGNGVWEAAEIQE